MVRWRSGDIRWMSGKVQFVLTWHLGLSIKGQGSGKDRWSGEGWWISKVFWSRHWWTWNVFFFFLQPFPQKASYIKNVLQTIQSPNAQKLRNQFCILHFFVWALCCVWSQLGCHLLWEMPLLPTVSLYDMYQSVGPLSPHPTFLIYPLLFTFHP